MNRPNKLPAVDAAMTLLFRVAHHWRGTTEAERYAVARDAGRRGFLNTKHLIMSFGIAVLLMGLSSRAKDPVPLLGDPPRILIVRSGGEVVAHVALTNRASVHVPTGRFKVVEATHSVTYRGRELLTVEIESARGNSFKVVAEEFELVW
jgi:hypothetical protein